MDFSKVRLDFGKTQLRGLPTHSAELQSPPDQAGSVEPEAVADSDVPGEVIAHAPQYTATLTPLSRDANAAPRLSSLEIEPASGYSLAVTPRGVLVWKRGNDSTLLFPLPEGHQVRAFFVPPAVGEPESQPGIVMIDRASGSVTYWESVSRALVAGADAQADAHIPLAHTDNPEFVTFIEPFEPVGFAVCTSHGNFYLAYLRDSLGRRSVRAIPLQPSNGLLARLRSSIGAYARDTVSLRAGRKLSNGDRELYILNMHGDLAFWRVGLSGTAMLVQEAQVGATLHMHMNILYPNSVLSLVMHDVAVEESYTHVLASFAPRHDSSTLYFVVASFTPELELVSVKRLQAYESPNGVLSERTALRATSGVLSAVLDTAVVFLDSPSRTPPSERRWEETVALKTDAAAIESIVSPSALTVSTQRGFVSFHFKSDRSSESTTQSRLEQAVFDSSVDNPLDLSTWPAWEYTPDPAAPKELAVKIAKAETPFLPAQLPSVLAHLELRAQALQKLYRQSATHDVREIAQAVVAATTLWQQYESGSIKGLIEKYASDQGISVRDLFITRVLLIPELVGILATRAKSESAPATALIYVLQACDADQLGTPEWAMTPSVHSAVETLAARAADAADAGSLAKTVTLLCSVTAPEKIESEPARLLQSLARLGHVDQAIGTAQRFRVFGAIAAIEVELWLSSDGEERTSALTSIRSLISEYGKSLATAIYDACIAQGQVAPLVQELAPVDPELAEHIELYLESRKMYSVAWTLEPATHHSTELLGKALEASTSVDARRLFASLYKLSALSVGANEADLALANRELSLVAAQESLATQYFGVSSLQSAIARHAFAPMPLSKSLSRDDAVDLLALAPPLSPAESNDNYIRAFDLVKPQDTVRQRLLIQQLICNSNWEPVDNARDERRCLSALRQTLFFHTLKNVAPAYAALLSNPQQSWFTPPTPEATRDAYPWDVNSAAHAELCEVAQLAESITEKYNVLRWIAEASKLIGSVSRKDEN